MNRRSFFSRLFGAVAACVAARHVDAGDACEVKVRASNSIGLVRPKYSMDGDAYPFLDAPCRLMYLSVQNTPRVDAGWAHVSPNGNESAPVYTNTTSRSVFYQCDDKWVVTIDESLSGRGIHVDSDGRLRFPLAPGKRVVVRRDGHVGGGQIIADDHVLFFKHADTLRS